MPDDTLPTRPDALGGRPRTGLAAWESTIGYIANEHSPDVLLTVKALPDGDGSVWSAMLEWGPHREIVEGQPTFPAALRELWGVIERAHVIFKDKAASVRKPFGYTEFDWLDADTKSALERLAWVTQVVFREGWSLIIIYQPTDDPTNRVQMRLLARDGEVLIGGRGPSIEDAASKLYRNATPYFSKRKN
jgi:hypothetical protein